MKKNSAPQNVRPNPMKARVEELFSMEKTNASMPGTINAKPILPDEIASHLFQSFNNV